MDDEAEVLCRASGLYGAMRYGETRENFPSDNYPAFLTMRKLDALIKESECSRRQKQCRTASKRISWVWSFGSNVNKSSCKRIFF
jgi:hypothetical protein